MTTGIHCLDSCENTPQQASWKAPGMVGRCGLEVTTTVWKPMLYLDTGEQDMAPIESPLVTLLPYLRHLLLLTEVAVPSD